ncbi:hypothetical protein RIF29_14999 [Crotalaria pallida]|uniref:Uncharacterized protein n=1 Tax=Crotalaria pallida TaxID=3830 RepID=A0AAN9FGI0_CROPI
MICILVLCVAAAALNRIGEDDPGNGGGTDLSPESDPVPAKKQVFASNLNYASPPFYPSGSSNKEINPTPKRDVQTGTTSRSFRPTNEDFSVPQNNPSLRGKNVVDSIGIDKLYIEKPMNNLHIPPSPGSSGFNASQAPHLRGPIISLTSTSVQAPAPQFGNRPGSGSQASSPTRADSGEIDSASESGKSKGALVGKGRGASQQGSGRGFIYGGPMGTAVTMGGGHGDPNFPAFLPEILKRNSSEIHYQEPPKSYFGKFKRNWALHFGFLILIYAFMVSSSVVLLCF